MTESLTHVLLPADNRVLKDVRRFYPAGRVERFTNGINVYYCYVVPEKGLPQPVSIPVWERGQFVHYPVDELHGRLYSVNLKADLDLELVWIDGQALHLPALEWLLLQILLLNGYTYVSRRMLLAILERQTGKMMQDNTLSVHIARLRRALGVHEGQSYIVTEPGKGYRWRFPVSRTLEPEMKKNELMAI